MKGLLLSIFTLLALASPAAAAQEPGVGRFTGMADVAQPSSWPVAITPAHVEGFGKAHFGMTEAEVHAAVAAEYGASAAASLRPADGGNGRTALETVLPGMDVIGPATAGYAFVRGRLVQVNLSWRTGDAATPQQRKALVDAATEMARKFYSLKWRLLSGARGRAVGENAVTVFSGEDALGNGAELLLLGVSYTLRQPGGTVRTSPPPTGPAMLRVSYAFDLYGHNDLPPGAF